MFGRSHARAISIFLAILVALGVWLLVVYDYRPRPDSLADTLPPPSVPQPLPPKQREASINPPATGPAASSSLVTVTYKCEKNGRVSFGDQPCGDSAKTLSVSTSTRDATRDHRRDLAQLKSKVAGMESDRLEREQEHAVVLAERQRTSVPFSKERRCKEIDNDIVRVDSILRQPHSAQHGDYWTGERRKLTDERFSLGC